MSKNYNLNIIFMKEGSSVNIQSSSNEMLAELIQKYCINAGFNGNDYNNYNFYYGSKKLFPTEYKSLQELNMSNGSLIKVVSNTFLNVFFIYNGKGIMVQGQSNMKFSELVTNFTDKLGVDWSQEEPTYLFNSRRMYPTEQKTLKELNILDHARIDVVLMKYIEGAIKL